MYLGTQDSEAASAQRLAATAGVRTMHLVDTLNAIREHGQLKRLENNESTSDF